MKKAVMTVTRFNEDVITTSSGPSGAGGSGGAPFCNWAGFSTKKNLILPIPTETFYNEYPANSFKANTTGSGTVYKLETTSVSSGDELWGGNESPFEYVKTASSDNQAGFLTSGSYYHFGYDGTTYYWYGCSDSEHHGLQ